MDRSALDFAATLQGEQAMQADKLRREAGQLRRQANDLDEQAKWHDERSAWAGQLADALAGVSDDA